jgi:catechol 2,3-dioxygenase-like lactoylglutathione lyase family enzyme
MKTHCKNKISKKVRTSVALLSFIISLAIPQQKTYAQQQAGIMGVEHIGINVPNMQQAVQFFTEVLGFTPVTQIGPLPLDTAWKERNHMHLGTGPVTIKMVRAGTGANIELFQYADNKGSAQQPGSDDIGATHIAFYTSGIKAGVAYLKLKGVQILGEPFLTPVGDTKGETWVYFLTPWGSKMELVSYPNGKAYEKANPKVLLWSPKNAVEKTLPNLKTPMMDTTVNLALVERHIQIWNEKDEAKRTALMNEAYASNVEMVDRHFIASGYTEITGFVNGLQEKNPTFWFTHVKPIDTHHNIARLFWQFGSKENPAAVTGMDLFVIENGKVQKLYVFVDAGK